MTVEANALAGDIAFVFGRNADGVHIIRRRSEQSPIEAGLLRPMREGRPLQGEVISLTQRRDVPMLYDVRSEFGGPAQAPTRPEKAEGNGEARGDDRLLTDGPAQVASDAYRKGWDAVWGRPRDRSVN